MRRASFMAVAVILGTAALYVQARGSSVSSAAAQGGGAASISCSLAGYKAAPGMTASVAGEALTVTWDGDKNQDLRLRFTINSGTPTISELAVRRKGSAWAALATNVTPEFRVVSGKRRMDSQQVGSLAGLGLTKVGPAGPDRYKDVSQAMIDENKWDAFWDAPLYMDDKNTKGGRQEHQSRLKNETASALLPSKNDQIVIGSVSSGVLANAIGQR